MGDAFQEKLNEELRVLEQNPQMCGEILATPLPDAFVEECKTREGAERVVKAAYIAGIVAGVDDPVGSLTRVAKHYGMEVAVVDVTEAAPCAENEKLN